MPRTASTVWPDVPGKPLRSPRAKIIGAGRPVLAIAPEGPAAELVRGLGMGWVVPPGAPARVADALEAAEAGRGHVRTTAEDREAFTRRALSARLAEVLGGLA